MHIEVLGCYGGESPGCRLTSLLINDSMALDAGSLTQVLSLERQVKVRSVLLTHSHVDHTNSLPFLIDNVFGRNQNGVDVYANSATIYAVRKHLLNAATWPDFSRLPNHLLPAVRFRELADETPLSIDGVTFTPLAVNHIVPTNGFLIEENGKSIIWSSDTGPTDRIWEVANRAPGLRAVFVEVSFDSSLQSVADESGHLTPHTLRGELEKLDREVPVIIHHLKPFCIDAIEREIAELGQPAIELLEQGRVYEL
jgi:ribonuclease BN (tRNA processing enzyme)